MHDDTLHTMTRATRSLSGARALPDDARVPEGLPARYDLLGLLGRGGMGEVWRVLDRTLNRVMALKVLRWASQDPEATARFTREAQLTAQLQHPGVVPVHDLGTLPDGRLYFTMQEVRGSTLAELVTQHHAGVPGAWPLRRLVDALHRACEAVAYAHDSGVVHGDLKPNNLMIGGFGEVLVLDWGLARLLDVLGPEDAPTDGVPRPLQARGTPLYMAPEQARGQLPSPASDVWALGAVLFELLTGERVVQPSELSVLLGRVARGEVRRAPQMEGFAEDCAAISRRAMAFEPEQRFPDARPLARALQEVLEGARRRAEANEQLQSARQQLSRVLPRRRQAAALRERVHEMLEVAPKHGPAEARASAWAVEDDAARLEEEADALEQSAVLAAEAALRHAPELSEAQSLLAEVHRARLLESEARRDVAAARRAERELRAVDDGRFAGLLLGTGALTLHTDPPGAIAELLRYVPERRRLVPRSVRRLGPTPLNAVPLEMGRYLVVLRHPGRAEVRLPVTIDRAEHVDHVPPGGRVPHAIRLPPVDALGPDDCYVPAGWFLAGGDPEANHPMPATRVWVDAFVMRRFPVTNTQYIAFLDDLVAQGREAEALRWAPRADSGPASASNPMLYGRDAEGRFVRVPDAEGDLWAADWPVFKVDIASARAYARWAAARDGLPWRLPVELEWEKAARGTDGRRFPWGDFFDPGWACTFLSRDGRSYPSGVGGFPADESPYGVRGLGGNLRDWCPQPVQAWRYRIRDGRALLATEAELDAMGPEDTCPMRGGSWNMGEVWARAASRDGGYVATRWDIASFRLTRSLGSPA
ncbi:MAG: SUMF1/EgtB/PvdO family nonheme iron enzyme [Alphaproteobacteria bacterium]|nr:SUMF1/EgtB/PvdO family nonheme iron enzyme [Alphaproteobacteria bacterium]